MMNAIVIFGNKIAERDFRKERELLCGFAEDCFYFDDISFVAFDNSAAMTSRLDECVRSFDNCVILCHKSQTEAVSSYLEKLTGGKTDTAGVLSFGQKSIIVCDFADTAEHICGLTRRAMQLKGAPSYAKTYIKCVGASPEDIGECFRLASQLGGDMSFCVYGDYGDDAIEILYTDKTPKMTLDGAVRIFATRLKDSVYALENIGLAEQLYRLLKLRRMKISVAESFTGGGVGRRLVQVPGVSEVFFESLNTYDNLSKMQRLGVDEMTLKRHGAVSAQTACEMAEGLLSSGNCDIALSTTGIAGPKSDNTAKPVGLAYIGVGVRGEGTSVYEFNFKGDRETITETAINRALFLAYNRLK